MINTTTTIIQPLQKSCSFQASGLVFRRWRVPQFPFHIQANRQLNIIAAGSRLKYISLQPLNAWITLSLKDGFIKADLVSWGLCSKSVASAKHTMLTDKMGAQDAAGLLAEEVLWGKKGVSLLGGVLWGKGRCRQVRMNVIYTNWQGETRSDWRCM